MVVNMEDFKVKPGMLMTVPLAMKWHSGYYLNENDLTSFLGEEMRLYHGDVVMFVEAQSNRFQPNVKRYKCLFGDRFILISERALVPV
jgi:hypothetical protein